MSNPDISCNSIHDYNRLLSVAFQRDVENLLIEFEKKKSLSFKEFAIAWKGMMFSYVFSEQQYYTFIKNFMDNAFFVLKKFIMFPKNVSAEVGALYIMYAMYFKQTLKEWVKIRLTLEEHQAIQNLILKMISQKQLEPLIVYEKLRKAKAFEYVFQRTVIAPEFQYLKNGTEFEDDTFQIARTWKPEQHLSDILNEDGFLENFKKISESYRKDISSMTEYKPGFESPSSSLMDDITSLLNNDPTSKCEDG